MNLQRILLLAVLFAISVSFSEATDTKRLSDTDFGFQIDIPSKWTVLPKYTIRDSDPPPDKLRAIKDYTPLPICNWLIHAQWQEDCTFALFAVEANSLERTFWVANMFTRESTTMKSQASRFKVKCQYTKAVISYETLLKKKEGDQTGIRITRYAIAFYNDNGGFIIFITTPYTSPKFCSDALDCARSLAYLKKKNPKKISEADSLVPKEWKTLVSQHYIFHYNLLKDDKIRSILACVERFRLEIESIIPPSTRSEPDKLIPKLMIKCFKSKDELERYAETAEFDDSRDKGYLRANNEVVFCPSSGTRGWLAEFYRDCAKQYMNAYVGGVKAQVHNWIYEGIAQYFFCAGMSTNDKIVPGNKNRDAEFSLKYSIRRKNVLLLELILRLRKNDTNLQLYSWSLAHLLLQSPKKSYKRILANYFRVLKEAQGPILFEIERNRIYIEDIFKYDWFAILDDSDPIAAERRPFVDKYILMLIDAAKLAEFKAFEGIDMAKLQKAWTDFYSKD